MQKAWVVFPAGFAYEAGESEYEVLGHTQIYMRESISNQLLDIPEEVTVLGIITPNEMDEQERQHFKNCVNVAWCGLQTTRSTIKNLFPAWLNNSHRNFHLLSKTMPVDKLKKKEGTKRAIICANGPSLKETLQALRQVNLSQTAILSCWHSAYKVIEAGLPLDYVCHTDNAVPCFDFKPSLLGLNTTLIATPKAAHEFVSLSRHSKTFTYIPIDIPFISGIYAAALQCSEHENIVSTVASMVFNCSVYAGYDEIILAGVDNGWVNEMDAYPECQKSVGVENQHGLIVQTYAPFALAALGIENKIARTPNLKVYQTAKTALDISGVEYKPIGDLFSV